MEQGINRVVISVWDLDAAMEFFSELLGSVFAETTTDEGRAFGVRVSMNFEAGVELVAPLGDGPSPVRDHLDAYGEGISGVVFAVPDTEAAGRVAESSGWSRFYDLDYSADEIDQKLGGRFTRYKEAFFAGAAPLPGTVLFGEFES